MDGQEFDRITRTWARRSHRRGVLQILAGGLAAGLGWRQGVRAAKAQEEPALIACVQDADCVDGDLDPCTGASCIDGSCAYFVVDCIPGHVCCGNGACCPTGEPGACLADTDCLPTSGDPCEGASCEGGACVPFLVSCAPDFVCCGGGSCCPVDGSTSGLPNGCADDSDCDSSAAGPSARTRCVSGVCVPGYSLT